MLQNTVFVVNREPYCIWEVDLTERNQNFLKGLDGNYFDYSLKVHLDADDERRASVALRIAFHHALETLFSLLGAYIQATDCAYAWIAKCSNKALREFVDAVGQMQNGLFTKLDIPSVAWEHVSESVFRVYKPGTARQQETAKLFATLWRRLARELVDHDHVDEYNSLKHGFRIRSGGFAIAFGLEKEHGVPPPQEEMRLIGKSEHGSSFFRIETIGGRESRNLRSRMISINWEIENVVGLLQLTSLSISNVVSALRVANGMDADACTFRRPQDDADFDRPWNHLPGVTRCGFDYSIDERHVDIVSKEELMELVKEIREPKKCP